MTTFFPYDQVPEVQSNLKKLDTIPLTGAAPPFPWEEFSSRLARSFEREGLVIQPGEIKWRTKDNLYEGFGDSPIPLIFSIPSLNGQVCWVMPEQEMAILAALLLTQESHPLNLNDTALNESFYHFLALEVLYNLTQVSFDKTLIPILTKQTMLPQEDSLCWDISIGLQGHIIWGRLVISPEFRRSWVDHFAQMQHSSALNQQMKQLLDVVVHVEAGKTQLLLEEWKAIQPGDFLLPDTCFLDPETLNGRVILTLHGKQIFRAKFKDGTLKILELPLLHEVEAPMVKQPEDDDDFSDLDLPEENEESEFEDDDFLDDEDLLSEEEIESETQEEIESPLNKEIEEDVFSETSSTKTPVETKHPLFSPDQIPLTLTIELGQIQMTMDHVLKLEPGNLLESDIHPENGVNLTINGKVVAKGELLRIGEVFGVRILQVGR